MDYDFHTDQSFGDVYFITSNAEEDKDSSANTTQMSTRRDDIMKKFSIIMCWFSLLLIMKLAIRICVKKFSRIDTAQSIDKREHQRCNETILKRF